MHRGARGLGGAMTAAAVRGRRRSREEGQTDARPPAPLSRPLYVKLPAFWCFNFGVRGKRREAEEAR